MEPGDAIQLFALFCLVILSAFFSSAETALTTINKLRVRSLIDDNVKGAATVGKLIDNPAKMLSTILVGNNIVNISASSLATTFTINVIGNYAIGIATGILTLAILIFGEITPKTMATLYAEKLSLRYAPVILFLTYVLTPVTFITDKLSILILIIFRVDFKKDKALITEEELRTIVDVSHEEGVLESDEKLMITNVVDFGDAFAKDVMVPRIDMSLANTDMSYDELLTAFRQEQYSRMPVYSDNRDNIVGIVNLKDIFLKYDQTKEFNIRNFLRPVYFTYEYKKTSELLNEMKQEHLSMSVVLDEYGAVAGLVTLEDLLEEIVGEIRDEYDSDEVDSVQCINDKEYLASGAAKLEDINEAVGLNIESDDYDSIAGHIISLFGYIPKEKEKITDGNVTYTVTAVDKNRIDQIHIQL